MSPTLHSSDKRDGDPPLATTPAAKASCAKVAKTPKRLSISSIKLFPKHDPIPKPLKTDPGDSPLASYTTIEDM